MLCRNLISSSFGLGGIYVLHPDMPIDFDDFSIPALRKPQRLNTKSFFHGELLAECLTFHVVANHCDFDIASHIVTDEMAINHMPYMVAEQNRCAFGEKVGLNYMTLSDRDFDHHYIIHAHYLSPPNIFVSISLLSDFFTASQTCFAISFKSSMFLLNSSLFISGICCTSQYVECDVDFFFINDFCGI